VRAAPLPWARQGLLLAPPADHAGWASHAQAPTVLPLSDRQWRIYFGGRDAGNRSQVLYADFDPKDGFRCLHLEARPVIAPGRPGDFDADGVAPAAVLTVGSQVWLYYSGIVLRRDVPYQIAVGLAVSDDGGHCFHRACPGPVMAAGPHDPFFVSTPSVWRDGDRFRAVFTTGTRWFRSGRQWECDYQLRGAGSGDGLHWQPDPLPALELRDGEAGLGRQCVLPSGRGWQMWLCHRGAARFREAGGQAYRLQRAHSADGRRWQREDHDLAWVVPPQAGDWDAWMQAYPCVTPLGDEWIMVYNGNDFGRGGFGWARAARDDDAG
jgi:hypothetical protein